MVEPRAATKQFKAVIGNCLTQTVTYLALNWRLQPLVALGRNMGPLRAETLVKALAVFTSFWGQHGPPLRTETLVKALAFFTSFWGQHGLP